MSATDDAGRGSPTAGQVAIVTGGAAGIGAAICARLAAAGATVVAADLHDAAQPIDVSDPEQVERLVESTRARFGRLDLLVNNAGVAHVDPLAGASLETWRKTFSVNVEAAFLTMRAAARVMLDQPAHERTGCRGKIVNVSSPAAEIGRPLMPAYGASKAALNHLSRSAAAAFGERGISTTILYPGNVDNAMWPGLAEKLAPFEGRPVQEILDERAASSPSGRFQRPDEVAEMVVYIAAHRGSSLNGATLWSEPHVAHA